MGQSIQRASHCASHISYANIRPEMNRTYRFYKSYKSHSSFRRTDMKLTETQIQDALSRLGDWKREGDWLTRDLKFENFKGAMEFVNRVADEAEAMDHHPDILIHGWNKVRLSVMTHSEGGLTEKDFKLAERINGLV